MLQVCPSTSIRRSGFSCSAFTASSRIRVASGRSEYRSKSKCTSSNTNSFTGGRVTWIVTVSDAVPPLPSSTVTVAGTGPGSIGAVQSVWRSPGFCSDPVGVDHLYASWSPSGSCASAVTVELFPTSTEHGSQRAFTDGGPFCGGAGGGGGGGGGT